MNAPRVSKRDRKVHLSYDTPSRTHCSAIYPIAAPNGSEVIIYGHERGLRILWRGGRRRKEPAPTTANGSDPDVIVIDDSDEEQAKARNAEEQYEDVDANDDEDCPYPDFVQDIDIERDAPVWHIAIPSITPAAASQLPEYARTHMIIVEASSDAKVRLTIVPLKPPSHTEKRDGLVSVQDGPLHSDGSIPRGLAVKLVAGLEGSGDANAATRLIVAACGSNLNTWQATIRNGRRKVEPRICLQQQTKIKSVAFPTSRTQTQLLVSDRDGNVRVFDFTQAKNAGSRPTSSGSGSESPSHALPVGRWTMSYHAPFLMSTSNPAMTRRKTILASSWILSGRGIMVLLEDGEWGIWMDDGGQPGRNVLDFALRGFVGESSSEVAESGHQKKIGTKLAPMTPNTRRTKSEKLFSGPQKAEGVASSGGIAIAPVSNRSGAVDESVIIWYNNDIYSIPSMQNFWLRNNTNTAGASGSLYAPGLTHITDINLMNENITTISQLASNSTPNSPGAMNRQRGLLVSAEHRFIILQNLQPVGAKGGLFQQAIEQPTMQDQRMLDAGELDIGGMDRMLDNMAAGGSTGRSRRVGFAS